MTPQQIAKTLKISISSVYNLRNGYFAPGRELANDIATMTGDEVSSKSWDEAEIRARKKPKPKRAARRRTGS